MTQSPDAAKIPGPDATGTPGQEKASWQRYAQSLKPPQRDVGLRRSLHLLKETNRENGTCQAAASQGSLGSHQGVEKEAGLTAALPLANFEALPGPPSPHL